MGQLNVKDKDIAIPGEVLATGMDYLPSGGTFRERDDVISTQVGLVSVSGRIIKVIPLSGKYMPKKGDTILGEVVNIGFNGWTIDLGGPYLALLSLKDASSDYIDRRADLAQYYSFGDKVAAMIVNVSKSKMIDLSMKGLGLKKLKGGKIIEVTPSKVPRIIGRAGSMISMVKEMTGCKIIVGQNGKIWVSGNQPEEEAKATEAIMMIEDNSHTDGLTDKIKEFLEKK